MTRQFTLHTEVSITADLRHRAHSEERVAKVNHRHGMTRAATRERRLAAGLRAMAVLVEWAPVEVAQDTPAVGVLVRMVNLQTRDAQSRVEAPWVTLDQGQPRDAA